MPRLSHRPAAHAIAAVVLVAMWALAIWVSSASAATWSIQSTLNAGEAEGSQLYDIGCNPTTTETCVAVGKQTESGGGSAPYAQTWKEGSWVNQPAVVPEGATAGELQAADCAAAGVCFAGGSYTSGGTTSGLVEFWIGGAVGKWSKVSTPSPEGASETAYKGVVCRELSGCMIVGYAVIGGSKYPAVLKFESGVGWTVSLVPRPEGAVSAELNEIDCWALNFCIAVGSYTLSGGSQWAWSATLSGESWTVRTVSKPVGSSGSDLLGISCSSLFTCTAVGSYEESGNLHSFVQRWNGSSWSQQSSPSPEGATDTVLRSVYTREETWVAVGDWSNGEGGGPMAQEWNGSAWVLDTTSTPEEASFSFLEGVACRTGKCLASGWYTDSGGKDKTLGESR